MATTSLTQAELEKAREMARANMAWSTVSKRLGRSVTAVRGAIDFYFIQSRYPNRDPFEEPVPSDSPDYDHQRYLDKHDNAALARKGKGPCVEEPEQESEDKKEERERIERLEAARKRRELQPRDIPQEERKAIHEQADNEAQALLAALAEHGYHVKSRAAGSDMLGHVRAEIEGALYLNRRFGHKPAKLCLYPDDHGRMGTQQIDTPPVPWSGFIRHDFQAYVSYGGGPRRIRYRQRRPAWLRGLGLECPVSFRLMREGFAERMPKKHQAAARKHRKLRLRKQEMAWGVYSEEDRRWERLRLELLSRQPEQSNDWLVTKAPRKKKGRPTREERIRQKRERRQAKSHSAPTQ